MPAATGYIDAEHAPSREEVNRTPGLLLLEFGTQWCGYCLAVAPRVAALLDAHPEVKHVKVEDGPSRPLGRSFTVRLWPSFVFLRDGQVVRQLARPGYAELEAAFGELVGDAD